MAKCESCGKKMSWWQREIEGKTCKACKKKRLDFWVSQHDFKYGDKVTVLHDKDFYPKEQHAVVVDRKTRTMGAWGYYYAFTEYKVKYKDGKTLWLPTEELTKA